MKHPGAIKARAYLDKRFAEGVCADCPGKVSKFKRCVACRQRRALKAKSRAVLAAVT